MTFQDMFEITYECDGRLEAVTRNCFVYEDDCFSYKYRFVVEAFQVDWQKPEFCVLTYMVPTWDSLCLAAQLRAYDVRQIAETDPLMYELSCGDIVGDAGVLFDQHYVTVDCEDDEWFHYPYSVPAIADDLEKLADNEMFFDLKEYAYKMSRPQLSFGCCGWDIIEYNVCDGVSPIVAGLERWNQQ